MIHELSDPPTNRHGDRVNGDYLSPSCKYGMDEEGCVSNACSCTCHGRDDFGSTAYEPINLSKESQ